MSDTSPPHTPCRRRTSFYLKHGHYGQSGCPNGPIGDERFARKEKYYLNGIVSGLDDAVFPLLFSLIHRFVGLLNKLRERFHVLARIG